LQRTKKRKGPEQRKEMVRLPGAPSIWLHRYACLVAFSVLGLIGLGGLVTSHNAGMAVPDWPTTYGYNMFFFPFSRMEGGILLEHSHRLVASAVGFLTVVLAAWIWAKDRRSWLRWTSLAAVAVVILQGVLGGLRVVLAQDWIGIFHAGLAHAFFVLTGFIALATSDFWMERFRVKGGEFHPPLRPVMIACAFIYLQLLLGATMRHQHAGLAVHDFPTVYGDLWPNVSEERLVLINEKRMAAGEMKTTQAQIYLHLTHRLGALAVFFSVLSAVMAVLRQRNLPSWLKTFALSWGGLVLFQIILGILTVWTNKAADIATGHAVTGALLLQGGALLCGMLIRLKQLNRIEAERRDDDTVPHKYVFSYKII
jgi:cytochrome c oxidase assembly protein subunit 15